jgi:hypothetical protein
MRKGVLLNVTLWVEGEDEPSADFAERAARAARQIVRAGAAARPELRVRVRRVEEARDRDEERGDD